MNIRVYYDIFYEKSKKSVTIQCIKILSTVKKNASFNTLTLCYFLIVTIWFRITLNNLVSIESIRFGNNIGSR